MAVLKTGERGALPINIAQVLRAGAPAERIALRWLGRGQAPRDVSWGELGAMAERAAAALAGLGIGRGDVVAVALGRVPEFYAAALGCWTIGAVFCPLFTAFGPGPLRSRLELGGAKALIVEDGLYARKIAGYRAVLPHLRHGLLLAEGGGPARAFDGCADFRALMAAAGPVEAAATRADDPAILHFTSGTTGPAKGAVHGHGIVAALAESGRQVFGLGPDDVFWCTADPGWVTCTNYGIIAPLACGATLLVDEGDVDPRRWYGLLRDEKVTAWYTTPTAIRTMMRYGAALARTYCRGALRVAASVGEPLNPEAVLWGEKALGVPFLDTWWQTETGAIAIANRPGGVPGCMGRPLPGVVAEVVRHEGGHAAPAGPGEPGELAIRADLGSLFQGYLGDEARTRAAFADGWYLTGDLVRRDGEGLYWFLGRADDMLRTGNFRIGPFELESVLMEHPAVAEAGVVGRPDPLQREVPVAFVTLNPGFEAGDALRTELLFFARQELGAALAPHDLHVVQALPKTSSGKIVRRLLRGYAEHDHAEDFFLHLCPGRFEEE